MASKAAKSKPSREVVGIKEQLQDLADRVLSGYLDRSDAAVVSQVLNVKLRALELERKIRETDELAAEIEELKREIGAEHAS